MTKLTTFVPVIAFVIALSACGNSKTKDNKDDKKDTTTVNNTPVGPKMVQLKWVDKGTDKNDTPHNEVVLSVDGKDSTIAEILACDSIGKAQYAEMEIPAEATTACGGWWAGAGEYFYALIKDGKTKVFYGWQSEEQTEKGYHWKELDLTAKKFNHFNFTE